MPILLIAIGLMVVMSIAAASAVPKPVSRRGELEAEDWLEPDEHPP